MKRKLVLANGKEFVGKGFGSKKEAIAELVFNTSIVGYQEILSDPSYTDQMICMTYPLIGNYGVIDEDYESKLFGPRAMIVHEYNDKPSNFRYTRTLNEVMEENDVVGLTHVDTRELTRTIRDCGAMVGIICDEDVDKEEALEKISNYPLPHDQISRVSCKKIWYSRCANPKYNVVAIDCGIKYNIIRDLNRNACNVTIVPYNTSYEKILDLKPDGIFLSNGPGDPTDVRVLVDTIKNLQGKKPIFGICLGHQIIALANGFETYKLKFGHRGANHPVKNLETGKIEITSQNHSYAVKMKEDERVKITHINLLDNTVEGLEIPEDKVFCVQYHPESAAGPEDSKYLFKKFIANMKESKEN
ncbi:MAG: glutamine-hydrolyzing carbamoyl-phosphate synthase small subunit [Erysipelotrichaceae bacterium]|nr:glutamine-hydrolyzing carbamoyl-phosphate synthase small subunit [Erysipelotrichaceae bacterium]